MCFFVQISCNVDLAVLQSNPSPQIWKCSVRL
uniref:Uncharacterized protein n=1 Tax=Anguilla anguilla TaxID=7936 RepID=A0A0E9V388_ANGAN